MTDNLQFSQLFQFRRIRFQNRHYTDNRQGVDRHYLAMLLEGSARIVTQDTVLDIAVGDCFYIPKGLSYRSYWEGEEAVMWDSFGFSGWPDREARQYPLQKVQLTDRGRVLWTALSADETVDAVSVGRLYSLLGELLPGMATRPQSPADAVYRLAVRQLREDPACSVEQLAKQCNVSVSGLYALFSRQFHTTPNTLRQQILVEKAVDLLTGTDRKVEDISRSLGFSSSSYFRKVIAAHTGKTPTKIRREAAI